MSDSQAKVLPYAPRQGLHFSRRTKHLILIIVALTIAGIIAPRAYRQMKLTMLVSEMSTYKMPADRPVFDTGVVLGGVPGGDVSKILCRQPPTKFGEIFPQKGDTIFVGELKNAEREAWLVQISLDSCLTEGKFLNFDVRTVPRYELGQPQSRMRVGVERQGAWFSNNTNVRVRIFAAQHDGSNPSHITIRVVIGDMPEIIDGYLNDDGTMTLELQDPPTTMP